jgi:hypothetical protein
MTDLATLTHDELMDELIACHRERARLDARELALLSALSAERVPAHEKRFVRDEIAAVLRLSPSYVYGRFELADQMKLLPEVTRALGEGQIGFDHARAIADAVFGMDEAASAEFEAAVLPYAQTHDVYDTRRKVKRELRKRDPFTAEERHSMGLASRTVWAKKSETEGLWFVGADLPAAGAAELMSALEFTAAQSEDDERTKPQRMADALVQLARDVLAGSCSHCDRPSRPIGAAVNVSVALSTLLGFDEQAGELNGEEIPAALARALAADEHSTWRRLLTDERGEIVDYGRSTYRPPTHLREYVVARDRTCRFPGCHRRAASCEIDHVVAWEDGGATNAENLVALCSRHHHLKHEADGWQLTRIANGVTWRSPANDVIVVDSATYPVDGTSQVVVGPSDTRLARVSLGPDAWFAEAPASEASGLEGMPFDQLALSDPTPADLMKHLIPDSRPVVRNNTSSRIGDGDAA